MFSLLHVYDYNYNKYSSAKNLDLMTMLIEPEVQLMNGILSPKHCLNSSKSLNSFQNNVIQHFNN